MTVTYEKQKISEPLMVLLYKDNICSTSLRPEMIVAICSIYTVERR